MRALIIGLIALTPASLLAQATITGRIINDSTKAAVPGVEVVYQTVGTKSTTDADGHFVLSEVPVGIGYVIIRKIGFRPVRLKALIFGRDSLDVEIGLRPSGVELPPLEVTASAVPPGMSEFAQRRLAGFGSFIDANVLRKSEHRRLSDLLRETNGVRTIPVGANKTVAASSRAGRTCPMAVWLDGIRIYRPGGRGESPPNLDDFPISNLEGVEIYRGDAETPIELGPSRCGTIVLWTRRS